MQPARAVSAFPQRQPSRVAATLALALWGVTTMQPTAAQPAGDSALPPADQWAVLQFTTWFNDAGTMVTDNLLRAAREAEGRTRAVREAVRTPRDQATRAAQVRARVLDILGGLPEKTPLNARVTGSLVRERYRVENISYEIVPGFPVSGNLYLPQGRAFPAPAIICPCGHSGKERPVYQSLGISLASNGFVALVTDSPDRGERTAPGNDHFRVGALTYLTGANAERYFTLDVLRGLDYLATRPEVDQERLGCTGVSGGAVSTLYASALDQRIKCAVPVCGVIPLRALVECLYTTCPEQLQQDTLGREVDEPDIAGLIAPRPLLLMQGHRDDLFYVPDFVRGCQTIADTYRVLGARERVSWEVFDSPHDYSAQMREAACRWFGRWIGDGQTTAQDPPEMRLAEPAELASAPPIASTIFSENAAIAQTLATERSSRPRPDRATLATQARELLGLPATPAPVEVVPTGTMRGDDLTVEKVVLLPEADIHVPLWVLRPVGVATPLPVVVSLRDGGRMAAAGTDGILARLARRGLMVVAADVRGTGETAMSPTRWDIHSFCRVERIAAWGSFVVSRPLVGMRTGDLLAVTRYAAGRPDAAPGKMALWGTGPAAVWALYAALLDRGVCALALQEGPLSYHAMATDMGYTWPDTLLLPNVLRHHDLPDVLAALAPQPALVVDPRDARGTAVSVAAATAELATASGGRALAEGLRVITGGGEAAVEQFLHDAL